MSILPDMIRRFTALLLIAATLVASNAWAWDAHGHEFEVPDHHAYAVVDDDGSAPTLHDESDHGCHSGAHFLAMVSLAHDYFAQTLPRRLDGTAQQFVSIDVRPTIDPPIA